MRTSAHCRSTKWIAPVLVAAFSVSSQAETIKPAKAGYPKVNLAVGYQVVPDWPQRPADLKWRYVTGVTVDAKDQVWILNAIKPQIQIYSSDGKFIDAWGSDLFKNPHFLRLDREGNVWAADYGAHVVMKFSPKGELMLTLGTPGVAGADDTHLNRPTDMAFAPNGDVFVTDGYGNNRIVHFDAQGKFVKAWGSLGVEAGQLSQPHSIAMDSKGLLYVAERNNCRVQVFDQSGKSLAQWRHLINPWALHITDRDEVLICGSSPARWGPRHNLGNPPSDQLLIKFDTTGRALELWTFPLAPEGTQVPGQLDWCHGLGVDSQGNLYIGDVADNSLTHRVQKFVRLPAER